VSSLPAAGRRAALDLPRGPRLRCVIHSSARGEKCHDATRLIWCASCVACAGGHRAGDCSRAGRAGGAQAQPRRRLGDDFTGGQLDRKRWNISSWWAPGYLANNHLGYYEPENVSLQGGYLAMRLWQEPGQVDDNLNGVISHGAHVTSKQKYGYGTYEWRMRMSSTATTPMGACQPVSGSVSAGFNYVNNSQSEIDFEFGAHLPETLIHGQLVQHRPLHRALREPGTIQRRIDFGLNSQFMTFKFVWEPGKISYYVNDQLKAVHTSNVPTAPAYFMINHWGRTTLLGRHRDVQHRPLLLH
jgi:endo-1,3-1,4-beta-glycanase ExoK